MPDIMEGSIIDDEVCLSLPSLRVIFVQVVQKNEAKDLNRVRRYLRDAANRWQIFFLKN